MRVPHLVCATALLLGSVPFPAPARVLLVKTCHGGTIPLPLGPEREDRRDCAGACHAACLRRDDEAEE